MPLNPTAIADRSAEAGYPLAFHTGTHMMHAGEPYLSLLGHRDLTGDHWTFDRREQDAFNFESELYIVAAGRRATGYGIDVPRGRVSYGEAHHYGDCHHRIVVSGAAGAKFDAHRRQHWVEIPGVAHGYVFVPDSALMQAIANLALISTCRGEGWSSTSGLVFIVDGAGKTLHIGSMSRRNHERWELAG